MVDFAGAPYGNRTRVFAVKGRRPGPLDDGRGLVENPVLPDRRDAIRSAVRAGKPDGRPRKTTATNTEETMRAIRIDHPGGPEVMRLEEVEQFETDPHPFTSWDEYGTTIGYGSG